MSETSASDPRDIRPVVALSNSSNWGLWAFLVALALGGLTLFSALSASRQAAQVPTVLMPSEASTGHISSPAPIGIPRRLLEPAQEPEPATATVDEVPVPGLTSISATYEPIAPVVPPHEPPAPLPIHPARHDPPRVVFEANAQTGTAPLTAENSDDRQRVTASRFQNPSLTVPQGTVIPAVLETALDSTRAGSARALVQRDIFGFDGTRVLIPRGSRLYGEYEAGLQRGENRALVHWSRLLRPDGVTINLDSPSSDPVGRAGIKGKVDSKFFQRFGNAILQSALDIGVGLAVNKATDGVIVALPGSTQKVQVTEQDTIVPTLKVKHGTSVSVFVAHDLDFSTVER